MFKELFKASLVVVTAPAAAVADAITLGGVLTDRQETYTEEALRNAMNNLTEAARKE